MSIYTAIKLQHTFVATTDAEVASHSSVRNVDKRIEKLGHSSDMRHVCCYFARYSAIHINTRCGAADFASRCQQQSCISTRFVATTEADGTSRSSVRATSEKEIKIGHSMGMRPGCLDERKGPPSLTAAGAQPNAGARGCLTIFHCYLLSGSYIYRATTTVVRAD